MFSFFAKEKAKYIIIYIIKGSGDLSDKSSTSEIIGSGSGSDGDGNKEADDGNASQKGKEDLDYLFVPLFFQDSFLEKLIMYMLLQEMNIKRNILLMRLLELIQLAT